VALPFSEWDVLAGAAAAGKRVPMYSFVLPGGSRTVPGPKIRVFKRLQGVNGEAQPRGAHCTAGNGRQSACSAFW